MMSGRIRSLFDRLGVRLALVLAVALFPLLVLSLVQSRSMVREAQARSEAALMGETLRAVAAKTRLIQQAEAETRMLARLILPELDDPARCSRLMRDALASNPHASFVGFTWRDGLMTCSSEDSVMDFSGRPRFEYLAQEDGPAYAVAPVGSISKTSVLSIANPVRNAEGEKIGIVSISLPHEDLSHIDDPHAPLGTIEDGPAVIMTFDRTGEILTSSNGLENAPGQLPVFPALDSFSGRQSASFMARSRMGERRVYSVVDLIPNQLYALGSRPADDVSSFMPAAEFPSFLAPALMWAASLFVAYFAMQKMVIGHVRRLSLALRSFASGSRIVGDLDVAGAPSEIRELAENYEKMTETILYDEAELEDTIHHKEVLLREVHHRVKNNLQLIASVINMQVRRARTPEAKAMMKGLQERVISLATVHRGLYMTTGLSDISANELIRDIVRQLLRATTGPERRFETLISVDPIKLTPDQAVPLSLLLTEAMTNAVKYAARMDGPPVLEIGLVARGQHQARLFVRNSLAPEGAVDPVLSDRILDEETTGLGSQLLNAFAQQLGGVLKVERADGTYTVAVEFGIRPLTEGEWRHEEAAGA